MLRSKVFWLVSDDSLKDKVKDIFKLVNIRVDKNSIKIATDLANKVKEYHCKVCQQKYSGGKC